MADKRAQFIGVWETLPGGQNRPAATGIWLAARAIDPTLAWANLRDTGQENVVPEPNVCVWEVDRASEALLDALEDDPQGRFEILWEETL